MDAQVILVALKTYGMILPDNSSDWYLSGAPDDHWNDDILHQFARVKGKDLEVVQRETSAKVAFSAGG